MVFLVAMYGCESWTIRKAEHWRIDAFELWCWRRLLRVPWTARRSVLSVRWKDWCWSWNSNTLATWCEELTHLKRPWCWERLRVRGEGDNGGWDGWMPSLTQWTWVWVNSGCWCWVGRPSVLQSKRSQRVKHDWATVLKWTEPESFYENFWRISGPWTGIIADINLHRNCAVLFTAFIAMTQIFALY